MFKEPPFTPIAGGIGLVVFTIFAVAAPLDSWWPLLAGPAEYQQTLTEARFIPLQPYLDSGCPWRSVVSWQRLRATPDGIVHFRAAFAQGHTLAARILAVAGLMGQDTAGWLAGLHELRELRGSGAPVAVVFRDQDRPQEIEIDSMLTLLEAGVITRELAKADLRSDECWHS